MEDFSRSLAKSMARSLSTHSAISRTISASSPPGNQYGQETTRNVPPPKCSRITPARSNHERRSFSFSLSAGVNSSVIGRSSSCEASAGLPNFS
ncbi:hypothetical protein D1872_304080 [compost metagenome]